MIQQTIQIHNKIFGTNPNLTEALTIFAIAGLIYFIKKYISKNIIKKFVEKTPTQIDDDLFPLFDRLSSILIWVIASFIALPKLGINVNALLATVGASSILIAYACKDTLSNIIAGLVIMADRPFRINDEIQLSSKEYVRVLDIGLRRSHFLYFPDGKEVHETANVIVLPNSDLAKSKIMNYTFAREYLEKERVK